MWGVGPPIKRFGSGPCFYLGAPGKKSKRDTIAMAGAKIPVFHCVIHQTLYWAKPGHNWAIWSLSRPAENGDEIGKPLGTFPQFFLGLLLFLVRRRALFNQQHPAGKPEESFFFRRPPKRVLFEKKTSIFGLFPRGLGQRARLPHGPDEVVSKAASKRVRQRTPSHLLRCHVPKPPGQQRVSSTPTPPPPPPP